MTHKTGTGGKNAMRNQKAWKAMSFAERETGKTAEELDEVQRRMREDFYRRQSA